MLVGLASCLTAGVAAVAQNRGIQLRSVEAKLEGTMDIRGILGIDSDVRNGYDDIKVTFKIDADASKKEIEATRRAVAEALGGVRRHHQPGERHRRSRVSAREPQRRAATIERVTTVVIGAGHAGLAASRCLTERSIDHVVLERGEVANSWRRERWDSLRLLTPNWQSRLPGYRYDGADPDGYMTMGEVVEFISRFASVSRGAGAHRTRPSPSVTRDGRRLSRRDEQRRPAVPQRGDRERRVQSPERAGAPTARAGVDRAVHRRSTTATRRSCRKAACWSSARRRPACSWPTKSIAPAGP